MFYLFLVPLCLYQHLDSMSEWETNEGLAWGAKLKVPKNSVIKINNI